MGIAKWGAALMVAAAGCSLQADPLGQARDGDVVSQLAALQAEVAALRAAEECPRMVLRDGSRRSYAVDRVDDVVRCVAGDDEMVAVGDFWIDRFEATVWENSDCTGGPLHSTSDSDFPEGFVDNGNWSVPAYACSVSGVLPSRWITWFQASQACALSGKHLCTNYEWQTATAGTHDPGSFDGTTGPRCHTHGNGPRVTGLGSGSPASSAACVSRWGAEDMVGNVLEWVTLWEMEAGKNGAVSTWPATDPADYGGDAYVHGGWRDDPGEDMDGSHLADDSPSTGALRLPAGAERGGSWSDDLIAGNFTIGLGSAPTMANEFVGFRCCYHR